MPKKEFVLPTEDEICDVLKRHPLIKLREAVRSAFLVGSFAKSRLGTGSTHDESDVDILLEVEPRSGESELEMEERYRQRLRQYFVTHGIRGKADDVHPQWCGRRVDVYFTYDASLEMREKVALESARPQTVVRATSQPAGRRP